MRKLKRIDQLVEELGCHNPCFSQNNIYFQSTVMICLNLGTISQKNLLGQFHRRNHPQAVWGRFLLGMISPGDDFS